MRDNRAERLSARQEQAIVALINETTIAAASRASGIGQRTPPTVMWPQIFSGAVEIAGASLSPNRSRIAIANVRRVTRPARLQMPSCTHRPAED